jgi:hypothetical protein
LAWWHHDVMSVWRESFLAWWLQGIMA